MRKKLKIILIILVTAICIYSGFKVRENNGIVITQIQTELPGSLSYMLETNKNNIIMIDGGSKEDYKHLEEKLKNKGGVVEEWFITIAHPENFGALQEIIKNGNIEINHIYISFNQTDWYEKNDFENYQQISEFLDLLHSEEMLNKVDNVPLKFEILSDNLYIKVLNAANTELEDKKNINYNQSMALKINNTYKSVILMGNVANEGAYKIKDNNMDELNCDAVQISNNIEKVSDEIYQLMSPKKLFVPISKNDNIKNSENYIEHLKNLLTAEEVFVSSDGDTTIKIW